MNQQNGIGSPRRQLVECFLDWQKQLHSSGWAAAALHTLTTETLKRIDSPDPQQRQFDALDLAEATDPSREWDYDQAKQWLVRANLPKFVDARKEDLRAFFMARGHASILLPRKSETSGRHRAAWFLEEIDLSSDRSLAGDHMDDKSAFKSEPETSASVSQLVYQFRTPAEIRLGILGRLLMGRQGWFPTKSLRGVIWAFYFLLACLAIAFVPLVLWAKSYARGPVTAGDLASIIMLLGVGWLIWRFWLRPLVWLLEDRIIPAPELVAAFTEEPCQLEMFKEARGMRFRLVRFSGTCPICAGEVELRYGHGHQERRLFGCCRESPLEHRFTFDRVTRLGRQE